MNNMRGLAILSFIFLISCDFKFPEKWENPSWELPINVPFLETTYYFSGMEDSTTIFIDSEQTFYAFFQDSLDSVGIDDSFDPYFEFEAENTLDLDEFLPIGPFNFPTVNINDSTQLSFYELLSNATGEDISPGYFDESCPCVPQEFIADVLDTSFNDDNDDLKNSILGFEVEGEPIFNRLESISVDLGRIYFNIENQYPFEISNVEFKIWSGENTIFDIGNQTIEANTGKYNLEENISTTNPILLNGVIYYDLRIYIDPQQNPVECFCGLFDVDGFILDNVTDDLFLNFSFGIEFDHFNELIVELNQNTVPIQTELAIPSPENVNITGGKLVDEEGKNYINSTIENNFFTSLDFIFSMENLYSFDENLMEIPFEESRIISQNSDSILTIFFNNFMMKSTNPYSETIENIDFSILFKYPADEDLNETVMIDLDEEYSFSIHSTEFAPFKFEYINTIVDSMEFTSPSVTMDNVPSGFQGLTFSDIVLELNIFNQIGLPVELKLELLGIGGNETVAVPLNSSIDYPGRISDILPGEAIETNIIMNGESIITNFNDQSFSETIPPGNSITELMNFAPEIISVGGNAVLAGSGIIAPQTFIWGDFSLNIPFTFLFNDSIGDLKIVPNSSTALQPLDMQTRQQIENGLSAIEMNLDMENYSPLAMIISMMISDKQEFIPYYFDDLRTGSLESIRFDLPDEAYFELSGMGVEYVITESYFEDGDNISLAKFYESNNPIPMFWCGRLFDLPLPSASDINPDNGHVISSGFSESKIIISSEKMNWLTSNQTHYSIPIIEFIDSGNEPRTLQSTNYFKISSYLTFILDTGSMN